MKAQPMLIAVPGDLVVDVASAINHQAAFYRRDKGHSPEDVAKLMADADRLDDLAEEIDQRLMAVAGVQAPAVVVTAHVPAIAAACTALIGTEHEAAMIELLRSVSPFHPLLWRYAEIARDMETMREVAP